MKRIWPDIPRELSQFLRGIKHKVTKGNGPKSDIQKLQDQVQKLQEEAKHGHIEKLKEGLEELEDALEELEDKEKPPKPPKPEKKAKRIAILNNQTHQEIIMDTIHLGTERVYTLEGRDAQNNPAPLLAGDIPAWTVAPTGIVTLAPTADGTACEVIASATGTGGDCTVTATGKNAKGGAITGSVDINVPAAEAPLATRLELTAGPEIPV